MNNSLTGHVLSNPLVEVKENLAAGQAPISLNIGLQALVIVVAGLCVYWPALQGAGCGMIMR
jgi:hypothetical protein